MSDAIKAAEGLTSRDGAVVEWCPGTGCRHVVTLMRNPAHGFDPMLIVLEGASQGVVMFPPGGGRRPVSLSHWEPQVPPGEWGCFRPLFAALGWTFGPADLSRWAHDQSEQHAVRLKRAASSGGLMTDERLGRIVREAVGAMRPQELAQ